MCGRVGGWGGGERGPGGWGGGWGAGPVSDIFPDSWFDFPITPPIITESRRRTHTASSNCRATNHLRRCGRRKDFALNRCDLLRSLFKHHVGSTWTKARTEKMARHIGFSCKECNESYASLFWLFPGKLWKSFRRDIDCEQVEPSRSFRTQPLRTPSIPLQAPCRQHLDKARTEKMMRHIGFSYKECNDSYASLFWLFPGKLWKSSRGDIDCEQVEPSRSL